MSTRNIDFSKMEIPVIAEHDIVVIGAGPGGLGAGVIAAREGSDVLVVERYGSSGGMAVYGEVMPFMSNHLHGATMDRPVYVDWCRKMWEFHSDTEKEMYPFDAEVCGGFITKPEAMLAMESLLLDAGAKLLYHHTLIGVIMKDGRIDTAVFYSKSGLCGIRAKIFVDATGDGDLAVYAGAPFEFGNADGYCQPMTTCFKVGNVDRDNMPPHEEINRLYREAKESGTLDCPRENVLFMWTAEKDVVHFNTTRIIKKSGVDGKDLSDAEIEGRRQIRDFVLFLRNSIRGFEHAVLHSIAHHVGIRESRRIKGLVYQTADDFFNAAKYPDGIARVNYSIDIHNPTGTGTTLHDMPPGEFYELRYGTLIPENTRNLLMGCRALSIDHALHSSMRIMPVVCSVGQAAGMAASLCVRKNCGPSELPGTEVREKLIAAGAAL